MSQPPGSQNIVGRTRNYEDFLVRSAGPRQSWATTYPGSYHGNRNRAHYGIDSGHPKRPPHAEPPDLSSRFCELLRDVTGFPTMKPRSSADGSSCAWSKTTSRFCESSVGTACTVECPSIDRRHNRWPNIAYSGQTALIRLETAYPVLSYARDGARHLNER